MLRTLDKTNPMVAFIGGLIELPVGIAIVMATAGVCWHLAFVIMAIGILMIVEGFALLVVPKLWLRFWAKMKICSCCLGALFLILACYFLIVA